MEPASIRYKNPGAMWGGNPVSKKWGETGNVKLNDGTGQNNHIAVFPTYVQGICAQIDLWRGPRYRNKAFSAAIGVWSGGNSVKSYIKFVLDRVPGMKRDTIISDAFLNSKMGLAFLKAQAWHEAGKKYPAPGSDFQEAQRRVFGGVKPAAPPTKTIGGAIAAGTSSGGTAAGSGMSPMLALAIGVSVAVVVFVGWKVRQSKNADKVAAPAAPQPAPEVQPEHGAVAEGA